MSALSFAGAHEQPQEHARGRGVARGNRRVEGILAAHEQRITRVVFEQDDGVARVFAFARHFGKTPQISFASVQMSQHAMYYDSSKAVRDLGLPQSSIEGAIKKAVDWFRRNGYVGNEQAQS